MLITTYNEEEQILAAQHCRVRSVSTSPECASGYSMTAAGRGSNDLCKEKGVNYVTRSTNAHAKAGNINHALDILHDEPDPPEFVAIFDADFVAHRDFLWRTIPLFHDARWGWCRHRSTFSIATRSRPT